MSIILLRQSGLLGEEVMLHLRASFAVTAPASGAMVSAEIRFRKARSLRIRARSAVAMRAQRAQMSAPGLRYRVRVCDSAGTAQANSACQHSRPVSDLLGFRNRQSRGNLCEILRYCESPGSVHSGSGQRLAPGGRRLPISREFVPLNSVTF